MRKIIAFTTLSLLSLFVTNENAISKTKCEMIIKAGIAHTPHIISHSDTEIIYTSLQTHNGFFFKI